MVEFNNDPDALRKWMVSGPEIARLVSEFEESFRNEPSSYLHHNESLQKQKVFVKDVNSLLEVIEEMDNPFMDRTQDLTRLMSRDILSNESVT